MRILVIEPIPEAGGGSEAMSLRIAEAMVKRKHEVHLAYNEKGSLLGLYKQAGIITHQLPVQPVSLRKPFSQLKKIARVIGDVKAIKPDIIFTSHMGLARLTALIKLMTGIESVFHLGLPAHTKSKLDLYCRSLIKTAITPSEHLASTLVQQAWKNIQVIPNWVDTNRFKPAEDKTALRQSLDLPDCNLLTYIGRIVPEKGVELLIKAFANVDIENTVLMIIGNISGEYKIVLDKLIEQLGIPAEKIEFIGENAEPEKWIAATDIVVVPSTWQEPFGLVLIEAMSAAVIVLASNRGELPNILGKENGDLVFDVNEIKSLEIKIIDWLARPDERLTRGHQLRNRVQKRYSGKNSIDAYERIFTDSGSGLS